MKQLWQLLAMMYVIKDNDWLLWSKLEIFIDFDYFRIYEQLKISCSTELRMKKVL